VVTPTLRCACDRRIGETSFTYTAPPSGETAFDLRGQLYQRSYWRCGICRHEFSQHSLDLGGLYDGAYVESTYGDRMRETFDRIISLPSDRSDNSARVRRVVEFATRFFGATYVPKLLDIGAGLGVFPFQMKQLGWECTALDPDPRAGAHLRDVVGVHTVIGDFLSVKDDDLGRFDVVTLNKVLEHVEDPVAMLTRVHLVCTNRSFVYVEVPDGEAAAVFGYSREEFFVEHHHVFSPVSASLLAMNARFKIHCSLSFREPSDKFTICMFLTPA
jgi:SAM-dependent methyltransferase